MHCKEMTSVEETCTVKKCLLKRKHALKINVYCRGNMHCKEMFTVEETCTVKKCLLLRKHVL